MTFPAHIGMNLSGISYFSDEFPFIDRMKSAGSWLATGATDPIPLDMHGYPTAIPGGATSVYTMVGLDPLSVGICDTYVLTWKGSAAGFFVMGGETLSSAPGRLVFRNTRTDTNQTLIATSDVAGLTDMHLIRTDQEAAFNAGEIFNPALTSKLSLVDSLRYLDWCDTNNTTVQNWADRTTLDSVTWQSSGNSAVPIEVMVALANETKTSMWLNVPTYAADDYVRQMAAYVRDHLDPSLVVRLEYSNEVWNWQFQQAGNASQQADKLWGKDANGDGKIDGSDPAEHVASGWVNWYGYRAAQVASIARQVFAGDKRLRPVLATQTAWQGLEGWIIDGVHRAGLGSVSDLFSDYAITSYFDGMLRGANVADKATILGWACGGGAGMDAAFAAIVDATGLTAPDAGSLKWLAGVFAYHGAVAQKNGLALVTYEGGVDLALAGGANAEVGDLFRRMQADPRMGIAYTQMVADFGAAGGTLLNVLTDANAGFYGTLKSIYDAGSPEWDALVALEKAAQVAPEPQSAPISMPVPAPVPVTPALSTVEPRKQAMLELLAAIEVIVAKARVVVELST